MKTHLTTGPTLLAIALFASGSARAATPQTAPPATGVMVPQPTPDADALAAAMRVLATDPKNLDALTRAGELTLRLGDPTAAAVLLTRAGQVAPNNGRLKADEAAVLVHLERPGEALRLFDQAERLGYDPANFAAERGLAYDLIGQQDRAQRDYRLALKSAPDDAETLRRYALSLGISGKQQQALAVIDPLVRRQDHAGWRDRAFILAMDGDTDQAKKIAAGMLPATMASGLSPFFDRLPQLSATDRAFAVHFGEISATPQRLADAQLTPALPALTPEPTQLAAATPAPRTETRQERKRRERAEKQQARQQAKQQQLKPGRTAYATADTSAPQPGFSAPRAPAAAPTPAPTPTPTPTSTPTPAPVQVATNLAPIKVTPKTIGTPPPERGVRVAAASPPPSPAASAPTAAVPVDQPKPTPPVRVAATEPATAPATTRRQVGAEDRIIQNIIAGITVPASELGVPPITPTTPTTPTPAPAPAPVQVAAATPDPAAAAKRLEAANAAAIKKADDAKAAAAAKAAVDRQAKADAAKKAAADKAAADKKAADLKAAADKKAAEKKAKAAPSRIWVQVAGGANENDLPKAWAAVKAKAPTAFKGQSGWSTPLNATNRVLAGPFKTSDAAQDFVNALKKEGVSGFPFTSTDGQKIDKLPTK
ncbi:hypothetical protein EAH87_01405 [Sphingomonas koreensis]|nr:hypothetical protein EAH87_01405 [Sphingomonas koreensis]